MANGREILPELLKLPAHERARLATELVQSLDESEDPDAAEAWLEELDRRAREVVSGTAKLEDWTEVRRRIELRLRAQVKRRFLDEWVKAVNEHGGFGAWAWEVSKNPGDIKDLLAKHAQRVQAAPANP